MRSRSVQRIAAWLLAGSGLLVFMSFSPTEPQLQRVGAAIAAAGVVWHLVLNRLQPEEQRGFTVITDAGVETCTQPPSGDITSGSRRTSSSSPPVPLYRRILAGILLLAAFVLAVLGIFAGSEPARANAWTAAFGLGIWGVAIRFQHVRL